MEVTETGRNSVAGTTGRDYTRACTTHARVHTHTATQTHSNTNTATHTQRAQEPTWMWVVRGRAAHSGEVPRAFRCHHCNHAWTRAEWRWTTLLAHVYESKTSLMQVD